MYACMYLVCEMCPNYPEANVVGAALKFRKRNGNLSCVHVFHKTLNLAISRRCFVEDGKEMYKVYNARTEPEPFSLTSSSSMLKVPTMGND